MDYNATKGDVDTVDIIRGVCFTSKTTRRWSPLIVFHLFTCINSFKFFKANDFNTETIGRTYTYNLALLLMEKNLKRRR